MILDNIDFDGDKKRLIIVLEIKQENGEERKYEGIDECFSFVRVEICVLVFLINFLFIIVLNMFFWSFILYKN